MIGLYARASVREGVGHVVRLRSIGMALRALGAEVRFYGEVCDAPWLDESLASVGLRRYSFGEGESPTVLVLDTYTLNSVEQRAIYSVNARVVQIRDPGMPQWPAELEIIPAPVDVPSQQRVQDRNVVSGEQFIIIRDEVQRAARQSLTHSGRLLVFLGGFSRSADIKEVVNAVIRADWTHGLDLVTEDLSLADPSRGIAVYPPGDAFLDLAMAADPVITASGGTAWEMVYLNRRLGVVQLADNQRVNYRSLTQGGHAIGLGSLPGAVIAQRVAELLSGAAERRQETVVVPDGLGARRCAEQILALLD